MGTVLRLRTINQTTEPRSQTILYGKVKKFRPLVRFGYGGGELRTCEVASCTGGRVKTPTHIRHLLGYG
jgi:hypothetical protein